MRTLNVVKNGVSVKVVHGSKDGIAEKLREAWKELGVKYPFCEGYSVLAVANNNRRQIAKGSNLDRGTFYGR